MKKSFLIIIVVFTFVFVSCDDSEFPEPQLDDAQSTQGGGDDDEDPIIEEGE